MGDIYHEKLVLSYQFVSKRSTALFIGSKNEITNIRDFDYNQCFTVDISGVT